MSTPTPEEIEQVQAKLVQAREHRGIPADGNHSKNVEMRTGKLFVEPTPEGYLALMLKDRPAVFNRVNGRMRKLKQAS